MAGSLFRPLYITCSFSTCWRRSKRGAPLLALLEKWALARLTPEVGSFHHHETPWRSLTCPFTPRKICDQRLTKPRPYKPQSTRHDRTHHFALSHRRETGRRRYGRRLQG